MPKNKLSLDEVCKKASIPGVTIATLHSDGKITPEKYGKTNLENLPKQDDVKPDTIFGAASLSKVAFSYLVLKLIDKNVIPELEGGKPFDLKTPLSKIFPIEDFYQKTMKQEFNRSDIERTRKITTEMILSHQSGMSDSAPKLDFEPGTEFGYSGMGLIYLQKIIKKVTGKTLDKLAEEYLVAKPPQGVGMSNSSFIPPPEMSAECDSSEVLVPPIAANSLFTTSSDFALLMSTWMNDESEIMQKAFQPQVRMTKDQWAVALEVHKNDLEHVAWGLGVGLELDDEGNTLSVFHTGDMDQWRAWVAVDFESKSGVVYIANGQDDKHAYGHILAKTIIPQEIKLEHAMNWFFKKYGFASDMSGDWKADENANMENIIEYLKSRANERLPLATTNTSSTAKILSKMKPTPKSKRPSSPSQDQEERRHKPTAKTDKPSKHSKPNPSQSDNEESSTYKTPTPFSRTCRPDNKK